jgi:hypothetical protein
VLCQSQVSVLLAYNWLLLLRLFVKFEVFQDVCEVAGGVPEVELFFAVGLKGGAFEEVLVGTRTKGTHCVSEEVVIILIDLIRFESPILRRVLRCLSLSYRLS